MKLETRHYVLAGVQALIAEHPSAIADVMAAAVEGQRVALERERARANALDKLWLSTLLLTSDRGGQRFGPVVREQLARQLLAYLKDHSGGSNAENDAERFARRIIDEAA